MGLVPPGPGLRPAGQGIGQVPQRGILLFPRPEVQHQRREIRLVRDRRPPLSQLLGTPLRVAADALAGPLAFPGTPLLRWHPISVAIRGSALNSDQAARLALKTPLRDKHAHDGGTSLQASHTTGAYIGETAWNTPADPPARPDSGASGGGFSQVFPRPAYQDGVPGIGAFRGVPDVAADAAPSTGMTLATTDGGQDYILAGPAGPAPPRRSGPR